MLYLYMILVVKMKMNDSVNIGDGYGDNVDDGCGYDNDDYYTTDIHIIRVTEVS